MSCRRVVVATLLAGTLVAVTPAATATTVAAEDDTPGVYIDELPTAPPVVGVATGVVALIGGGKPATPGTAPRPVSSTQEFAQLVSEPSPALERAVADFFGAGGTQAVLFLTASEDGPALVGALDAVAGQEGWDLLVAPALGALTTSEWLPTATAMAATADRARGIALLDPPADAVAAASTDGGAALVATADGFRAASEHAAAATLYSSGLVATDDNGPVATAPFAAGIVAATDAAVGPWGQPAGPDHPLDGVTPALLIDNDVAGTLDAHRITPVMTLQGYGTVLMGSRTLSPEPDEEYLSTVRTVDFVATSIDTGLEQYVFAPNDGGTWAAVASVVSQFLTTVWQEGGLIGEAPADAFTAAVGLGSTMTAQDVLDGNLVLDVTVVIQEPGQPIDLTFTQQMQGP